MEALKQPIASPFPFLHVIEQLKQIPRRGWEKRGVRSPESVSDHMYRMAIMIMMAQELKDETRVRAIKMALVHDIGEALTGDITPSDGVTKAEKHCREFLALQYLACLAIPVNPDFANELKALWSEYEEGTSEAARWVRAMDALECMDQAVIYEERSLRALSLGEFMELESKVNVPELDSWVAHIKEERDAVWSRETARRVILFVLGGPGVGKGTQCAKLAADFGGAHISVGDLLREEAKSPDSIFADFINESIRNSVIIPADLTIKLLQKKMSEHQGEGRQVFIIDGFPRSLDQACVFEEKIHRHNFTVSLHCSEATMLERLTKRSEFSDRIDDNTDSMLKRVRTFSDENSKIEEHFQQTGRFWKIDAESSVDDVYCSVRTAVEEIVSIESHASTGEP